LYGLLVQQLWPLFAAQSGLPQAYWLQSLCELL